MSRRKPRPEGGRTRRSFTPAQKLALLAEYEQAVAAGEGGVRLRREGLYSSSISQWRKERGAGALQARAPGESVGQLSAQEAEIARLKRQLEIRDRELATTQAALAIMGKAHELLESISESSTAAQDEPQVPEAFRRGGRRGRS